MIPEKSFEKIDEETHQVPNPPERNNQKQYKKSLEVLIEALNNECERKQCIILIKNSENHSEIQTHVEFNKIG